MGQNGQTNRVPCAFAIRSTMTAQPGLHSLYRTGSGGATTALTNGRAGFAFFALTRFVPRLAVRFTIRLRRAAVRVVRVARIAFLSPGGFSFTAGFLASVTSCTYFRRSTMCLSVRLLCRVFFPNVGKAQGVCG